MCSHVMATGMERMLEVLYLYRKLQSGQDVLHFRLEIFWPQFSFSDAHLIGEEHHLQDDGNQKKIIRGSIERVDFANFLANS